MEMNLSFKVPDRLLQNPHLIWAGGLSVARQAGTAWLSPCSSASPHTAESSAVPLQLHPLPATPPKIDFTPAKGHRHQF